MSQIKGIADLKSVIMLKKVFLFFLTFIILFSIFSVNATTVSAAFSIKTPKIISASVKSSTVVKIKWKKVSGANGYIIYQKKGNGEYKNIEVIKDDEKTSYTKKHLKPATKYTYKVRAYKVKNGEKIYSSKSKSRTVYTKPLTPEIISIKSKSKTSLTVKWEKISKSDGYAIYIKNGNNYKRVKTINSFKTTSYTIKGLKSGKKYTFVIRAFLQNNGENVYSVKSDPKSKYTLHTHKYKNYQCTICKKIDKDNAYKYFKKWVIKNGEVDGSFVGFNSQKDDKLYLLTYNANTDAIMILYGYNNIYGDLELYVLRLSDFYYCTTIDNTNDFIEGKIKAKTFTSSSPITYTKSYEDMYDINSIVEETRVQICGMLEWLEEFLDDENIGITIADLGFKKY